MPSKRDRVSNMLQEYVQLWYLDWAGKDRLEPEVAERVPMFLLGPLHNRYQVTGQIRITAREVKHAAGRAQQVVEAERLSQQRKVRDQQIRRSRRRCHPGVSPAHWVGDPSFLHMALIHIESGLFAFYTPFSSIILI